jgi:hypothetical protein
MIIRMRSYLCAVLILMCLVSVGCALSGSSQKINIKITNNYDETIRFIAGGTDFLTYEQEFDRYVLGDIAAADVIVEIPSGDTLEFTLQPDNGNAAVKDWFIQYDSMLGWAPEACENNPDVNDFQFQKGNTYVMIVTNGDLIPDDLHFSVE